MNPLLKIAISALIVGAISEIGRRHTSFAAFLAALPLISLLGMIWIYRDTRDVARIAAFSWSVFWYVLPSLVLFVVLPVLLTRFHIDFYPALLVSSLATIAAFFALKAVLGWCGIAI